MAPRRRFRWLRAKVARSIAWAWMDLQENLVRPATLPIRDPELWLLVRRLRVAIRSGQTVLEA